MAARAVIRWLSGVVFAALVAAATASSAVLPSPSAAVAIAWHPLGDDAGRGEVRVTGLPAAGLAHVAARDLGDGAGTRLLRVIVAPDDIAADDLATLPAAWGAWSVEGDAFVFRPRHVLAPGTRLHARFDGAAFAELAGIAGTRDAALQFAVPAAASVAHVVAAAPGGDTLPANQLRLYVEFSHPMSLGAVEPHVRLRRGDGAAIAHAFASPAEGLWEPGRRRLTLIVHPGRVKQGLDLGDALGPVLVAGETVTLEIDAALRDAHGAPLRERYTRTWRVGAAVREPLDLTRWQVTSPQERDDALRVTATHALDRAVAQRALSVVRHDGAVVPGDLQLQRGERELRFVPTHGWQPGQRYRLVAAPFLEDASGNRPGRAFERDPAARTSADAVLAIEFATPASW